MILFEDCNHKIHYLLLFILKIQLTHFLMRHYERIKSKWAKLLMRTSAFLCFILRGTKLAVFKHSNCPHFYLLIRKCIIFLPLNFYCRYYLFYLVSHFLLSFYRVNHMSGNILFLLFNLDYSH